MAIKLSGLVSGMDTDAMVQELVSAYSKKTETYEKGRTKLQWKQEAWQDLNTKIYDLYSKTLSKMRFSKAYNSKVTNVSDESKATVSASNSAVKGTQTLEVKSLATSGYLTGAVISEDDDISANTTLKEFGITADTSLTVTVGGETKTISLNGDSKISDVVNQLNDSGVEASFDANNKRFFINSTGMGKDLDFELGGDDATLTALGLKAGYNVRGEADAENGAVNIDGADAKIVLNGATFTSDSNSFNINGLTIMAKDVTDSPLKLVTDTNVDEIYNSIKDFLKEYNTLINEMDSLYNASSAKGYEPLTDEEKEAMSEADVEKWEKKVKDSLLRRDNTLNTVASSMKSAMLKSFDVNGQKMSLSSFGIATGGYFTTKDNEKNAFHIDGDPDDSLSSGNDDKLRAAIASDPDAVADFFSQLTDNLYDELHSKMGSTSLSSAFKVYNDKQITSELSEFDKKIEKWEDYVSEQEEYWYSKFTAMEKALAQLQSSTSALTGLLGS